MLRVDVYTTTEGLVVNVIGHCGGKRHAEGRCETVGAGQLVPTYQIERYGLATAVTLMVDHLLYKTPSLMELALC